MRRVVAVLGAVLLVFVAVVARGVIDGDDASGGGGSSGGDGTDGDPGISLVCIEELQAVCDALQEDGEIQSYDAEPAGVTVDRLAEEGADLGADAWLTLDPFPGIADVARAQVNLGTYFGQPDTTGHVTQVGIAVQPTRAAATETACGDVDWTCLGNLVGDPWSDHGGEAGWGPVKVAVEDPASAAGLLTAAQAIAGHLGVDTFARNDVDNSDAIRWISRFDGGTDVLTTMVLRSGSFSAVGALGAAADAAAATARGRGLGIFYPAPMVQAEVLLAVPAGADGDLLDGRALADALSDEGWDQGQSSLPADAGTFYALREDLS